MKTATIIWSKDRPAQLDLLLRSQYQYFPNIATTFVIYRTTSELYDSAYSKLFRSVDYPGLMIIRESKFKMNVLDALSLTDAYYVLGNSDDNVFINPWDFADVSIGPFSEAFSLRLNPKVNFCHPANLAISPPDLTATDPGGRLVWEWAKCDPRGCWGYPHPCDSNIYRRDDLVDMLSRSIFHNPCTMENEMNAQRDTARPLMECGYNSYLISVSNNRIQDCSTNPCGDADPKTLAERFLQGERIKLEPFVGLDVTQCHIVKPYEWER